MANQGQEAFCTLITPPEGVAVDEFVRSLASEGLSDEPTLRHAMTRVPPLILAQSTPEISARCVGKIVDGGGDALSVTLRDLERLGGSIRVKGIRVQEDSLELELWRGPTAIVPTNRIDVFVLAHSTGSEITGRKPLTSQEGGYARSSTGGIGQLRLPVDSSAPETRIVAKNVLDIHTSNGSVFQIDGDKFGFDVLGDLRTQGDRQNLGRLYDMLRHLAPHAVGDTYYTQFKPPSAVKRLRLPGMQINDEKPPFAFYSRWVTLVYRHVMGG